MSKEKFNMGNLSLPVKPEVIKPSSDTQTILNKAVEDIHKPVEVKESIKPSQPKTEKKVASIKKISMDLPFDVYKELKVYAALSGENMKDYLVRLIEQDKKNRKP